VNAPCIWVELGWDGVLQSKGRRDLERFRSEMAEKQVRKGRSIDGHFLAKGVLFTYTLRKGGLSGVHQRHLSAANFSK